MRCGCPQCGTYMIQSESLDLGCVCPECLYRCRACMGTNTVVSREDLCKLTFVDHTAQDGDGLTGDDGQDGEDARRPLSPDEFID